MNIVEAYIKYKKQLLIFISGLPGCGKLSLSKAISEDFKLKLIDQIDYYKSDYNVKSTLSDGTVVINWYNDEAIDWLKLNNDINEFKSTGLIVTGISLPSDKLTSVVDYHIHLNISKQVCMEKRRDFLEKNKDNNKYNQEYKLLGTPLEKSIMNQLIYQYYLDSRQKSKINKFINITELSDDKVYDDAFDQIIRFITEYLYPTNTTTDSISTPKVSHINKLSAKPIQLNNNVINIDEPPNLSTAPLAGSIELLDKPKYMYDKEEDMNMVSSLTKSDYIDDSSSYCDDDDSDTECIRKMNKIRDGPIEIYELE